MPRYFKHIETFPARRGVAFAAAAGGVWCISNNRRNVDKCSDRKSAGLFPAPALCCNSNNLFRNLMQTQQNNGANAADYIEIIRIITGT
jgi:hypothetical protein